MFYTIKHFYLSLTFETRVDHIRNSLITEFLGGGYCDKHASLLQNFINKKLVCEDNFRKFTFMTMTSFKNYEKLKIKINKPQVHFIQGQEDFFNIFVNYFEKINLSSEF